MSAILRTPLLFNQKKKNAMKNVTYGIITTAIECLEALVEHVNELETECNTEAAEIRVAKAKNKLSSALGMVKDAFKLLDEEE